jgi:hypothetical protein
MPGIDTEYYKDSKPKGESLSVRLPLEHQFDILLLAGYQAKRVLLGSAYVNHKTTDGVADYVLNAAGYKIETGKANIINMPITAITVNPAGDFVVTYNGGDIDIDRNDDLFSIETAETAVTDAATALSGAYTKLTAIRAKFTTATTGIKDEFGSIKTDTDTDLASVAGTGTMRDDFAAANTTLIAKVGATTSLPALTPVTTAIGNLTGAVGSPINAAITALTNAITAFKTVDSQIIAAINAANDALPYAKVLRDKATADDTDSAEDIEDSVDNITTALAAINNTATTAGSLLEAVTQAKLAVSKTNEGARSATGNLVMAIPKASDATVANFVVKVSNSRFLPLYNANGGTDATLSTLFSTGSLTLDYSGQGQSFIGASVDASTPTKSGDTLTTTYTIDKDDMPDYDAYGILYFNTSYYPFSKSEAGSVWYIRNGVDNTKVDFDIYGTTVSSTPTGSDRAGGAVFVTIGKGGDATEGDFPIVTN